MCEKNLQHQRNIYHVFIDFKKAFDRVWHEALWATMKKFDISRKLIDTIQNIYENAMSAVLAHIGTRDWFHTSVGVRHMCLLSPTLFKIFLDDIMAHALANYNGTISFEVVRAQTSVLPMTSKARAQLCYTVWHGVNC